MNPRNRRFGIRQRLALLVVLPVVVIAALTTAWVVDRSREVSRADDAIEVTETALAVDTLAAAIQHERAVSLDGFGTETDLLAARQVVDDSLVRVERLGGRDLGAVLEQVRGTLSSSRAAIGTSPSAVGPALADELVEQTDPSTPGPVTAALLGYGTSVRDVVTAGAVGAESVEETELALRLQANSLLSLVEESFSLEALTINQALITDGWSNPALGLYYQSWVSSYDAYAATLVNLSLDEVTAAFQAIEASEDGTTVMSARTATVAGFSQGSLPSINVSEFQAAVQGVQTDLDALGTTLAASTTDLADGLRDDARRDQVLVLTLLLVVTLGLVIASRRVYRSVVDPVVSLTDAATRVASIQLPATIEAYSRLGADEEPPVVEPIAAASNDEIGALVHAVNDLHHTALSLAGEQAASRRNIAEMFVNLGRRSQRLTARQLSFLTDLEKQETDADTLENLFRLDSLATRMRRNAESLLVLSGAPPSRRYSSPASVGDVIRGATSEVEQYRRVAIEMRDHARISADAIADVSHLFAELIENALEFSAPDTTVEVVGKADQHGFIVAVSDHGIGMSDEELEVVNGRIADPPPLDQSPTRYLGLLVVGRLAERHGIRAKLIRRPDGGITAVVVLPSSVLVDEQPVDEAPPHDPVEALAAPSIPADHPPAMPVMAARPATGDRPPLPPRATPDARPPLVPSVVPPAVAEPFPVAAAVDGSLPAPAGAAPAPTVDTAAGSPTGPVAALSAVPGTFVASARPTPPADDIWPEVDDSWPAPPDARSSGPDQPGIADPVAPVPFDAVPSNAAPFDAVPSDAAPAVADSVAAAPPLAAPAHDGANHDATIGAAPAGPDWTATVPLAPSAVGSAAGTGWVPRRRDAEPEPGPDRFLVARAGAASTRELFERALRQPQPFESDPAPEPAAPAAGPAIGPPPSPGAGASPLAAFQAGVRRGEAEVAGSGGSDDDPSDDDPRRTWP